eukprot:TRINITY_DN8301_c0_g1_i1.p1 TRINITY_DN8301_c0_g1~~TRINITY_DN8301_c0_g1_i1.p1  ORF type:complete len:779 (+),score=98.24 TRINITY_DN8301_c0_g1_i1:135-2471(+)
MGIEDYWSVITEIFPAAVKRHSRFQRQQFNHVMVDLNHVLYHLASSASDEELIETTVAYLDDMLSLFPATKSVFVALDGPGPRAKFLVQRERREKNAERNPEVNTLKYTPGTEFMAKLQLATCAWAAQRASTPENKGIKFFVSGADREGEGEFKIYQHLMDIEFLQDFSDVAPVSQDKNPAPKDSVLLLGTDSDLVVSGFRLQILKNVDICVMRMLTRRELQMIDLRQLHTLMFGDLQGDPLMMIDDVTLLSLLSGSDYTPRLLGYSFKKAFLHYRALRQKVANKGKYIIQRVLNKETGLLEAWRIDTPFFRDAISFADHSTKTFDVVMAKVNGRDKKLVLNRLDPKSNLNTLAASLVKSGQLHYETTSSGLGRSDSSIFLVYPSGKRLLLAKATSSSPRKAEKEASQVALRTEGPFFEQVCRKALDSESLASLKSYISSIENLANAVAGITPQESSDEVASAAGGPTEPVSGLDKAARRPLTSPQIELATEASRTANEPAVVMEFIRMLVWTLEYYQGVCRGYEDTFHFIGAPSCDSVVRTLPSGNLDVPIAPSGRVLSPRTDINPSPPSTFEALDDTPLVPLAFFVSIMPSVSAAVKVLPEPLREPVLEYRAGVHRDMLGMSVDNVSGRISFADSSDELLKVAEAALSNQDQISSTVKEELRDWFKFSPSYVFFQPASKTSPELEKSSLALDSIKNSAFTWPGLSNSVSAFEKEKNSSTICIAENAPVSTPSKRRFGSIANRFMQRRQYHSVSKARSISAGTLTKISLARAIRLCL